MGCDIHARAEVFVDGKWELLGDVFKNPYFDPEQPVGKYNTEFCSEPYKGRSYVLFGLLAEVRFEGVAAIAPPRGIPADADKRWLDYVEEWGMDGHSHSYFTLKEMLDYPLWDSPIDLEGWVSEGEFKKYKETGKPTTWSGSVSGPGVFHITNKEMEELITDRKTFLNNNIQSLYEGKALEFNRGYFRGSPAHTYFTEAFNIFREYSAKDGFDIVEYAALHGFSFYTHLKWQETLSEFVSYFQGTLDALEELAPEGDPSRIRMLFFFDN